MIDDEETPQLVTTEDAPEAVEDAAPAEVVEAEAAEDAPGQEEDESPKSEDDEEKKSRSQRQRERRKAYISELENDARDKRERLERITKAYEGDEPPVESNFDDLTEYAAAKAVWAQSKRQADREKTTAQGEIDAIEARKAEEVKRDWLERVEEAKKRFQDFATVAGNPDVPITDEMAEVIRASDEGPDVLYHLGSNPAEAARISRLSANQQVFELGRIAASLRVPKPKTQTAAPAPIRPVAGRASQPRDPSNMSQAEFIEWRRSGGGS